MPPKAIFRTLNRIHIFLYRKSKGRILVKIVGSPVLLLTTTGRKTGKPRTVPIVYLSDEGRYTVIASDHPAWYRNLKSAGQAAIEVRGRTFRVTMRDAEADEASRLWEKLIAQSPAFKPFQGKENHQLVVLEAMSA